MRLEKKSIKNLWKEWGKSLLMFKTRDPSHELETKLIECNSQKLTK